MALMASASPRRRFQFSLRTLMIGSFLFCVVAGWCGIQYRLVRQRISLLNYIVKTEGFYITKTMDVRANPKVHYGDLQASLTPRPHRSSTAQLRRWLGDEPIDTIGVPANTPRLDELRLAFPEADFAILDSRK
ncbi:MAG TPA: hypothetical protein VG056_02445 [Pirellulales bacterium]|jgi:hypothetical protein|nr:hypothetical protein [Pirellulales bacterium]